jgi:NSS family neurotransmitter:Na+ symporter
MGQRENFGSRLGFILVSAGCAIGLGNVWKFPYICGQNGGAAFILIYLICLAALGIPILLCEFAIGRGSQRSIVEAFNRLEPAGTIWHRYKWFGMAGNYLLMMFYTMVGGWMLYYSYQMITGKLVGLDAQQVGGAFGQMLASPGTVIGWTAAAILISFTICALGLVNGVEKITKVMMILLIVLMLVLAFNSMSLSDAEKGVAFYLVPDLEKLKENGIGNVVFAAMTQSFFTLGLGIGSMEIFGSYLKRTHKLVGEAVTITILDTFVALVAGLIIIPACFSYGVQPDSGPPLLFITLPNIFNHMPGGRFWGIAFFVFMSFAALSTIIAVFENIVSMTMEVTGWHRKQASILNCIAMLVLCLPAILGYNLLANLQPLGAGTTLMDLEDFIVSYNLLPLGSLLFVLFCTRKNGWGWHAFLDEVNTGKRGLGLSNGLWLYMQFGVPLIIIIIYLKGYYDKFIGYGFQTAMGWMVLAVALLVLDFLVIFHPAKKKQK